jgi:glycerate kinase
MIPLPGHPFTVLIAPSGFKESLGAREVADHIATGVLRAMPRARILKAPMVDGGEGFTEALVDATGGSMHPVCVTGPVGEPVAAVARARRSSRWRPPPACAWCRATAATRC